MSTQTPSSIPFLKRNIARAVNAINGAFSPAMGRRDDGIGITEDGGRPRKRRRMSTPESDIDKRIVPPDSTDSQPVLRIEVLRCHHKDPEKARHSSGAVVSPDATSSAICRITISDMTLGRSRVLFCQGQDCKIVTFKSPSASHRVARIEMPHPICVPRQSLSFEHPGDCGWRLGDAYKLTVDLEPAAPADAAAWPPLDLGDLDSLSDGQSVSFPTRQWIFSGSFDQMYGRLKAPLILTSAFSSAESPIETGYEMDIDLQWSTGFLALENVSKPRTSAIEPSHPAINDHDLSMLDFVFDGVGGEYDDEDVMDVGNTPSRSLRTRGGEKNYNLKALSDKAHGKARKPRKPNASAHIVEGQVKYFLPSDQPVCLDGFRCVICGTFHQSLKHLQLHLDGFHLDYACKLDHTSQGPQFHVTFEPGPPVTPSKTLAIQPATRTFNLETFVSGNHDWVTSRLDYETKGEYLTAPEAKVEYTKYAIKTSIKTNTRTDAKPDMKPRQAVRTHPPVPHAQKKIIIPQTKHTFFHPVSKQILKVGQEVPQPVLETEWFHHKHHQGLSDLPDITPAELEYMKEFDEVLRRHDITARIYFPRAWLDFVKTKAPWLIEGQHRMIEFSIHMSYLVACDLIQGSHIQEAIGCIEEERSKRRKLQRESPDGDEAGPLPRQVDLEPPPKMRPPHQSASGCAACGLPVLSGPRNLICSNKV